jgi:hypothetical protein
VETQVPSRTPWSEERLREGLTMALYLSLVLAAEFVTLEGHLEGRLLALGVLWGTAIGLTLAHIFAFQLAALVFSGGTLAGAAREVIVSQVAAASVVAGILSLPILLLDLTRALAVDRFLIAAFVGVTGWAVARTAGAPQVRALAAGVIMVALGMAVIVAKAALAPH